MKRIIFYILLTTLFFYNCSDESYGDIVPIMPRERDPIDTSYIKRAEATFDQVFKLYWYVNEKVLFDKYPNPMTYNNTSFEPYDEYAYVWGYGAFLSAYNIVFQHSLSSASFAYNYRDNVMDGLDQYYTTTQQPAAYASFINDWDDRYYDDNVWVGIDLLELYDKTRNSSFLEKAKEVWSFLMSGKDDVLGGGLYWKEREKNSKNTCSNAPVAVFGAKLFLTTADNTYLETAKEIYAWTKANLQDPTDYLYWDNKKTNGTVETPKFSYNSGQMIQAAVLLYTITNEDFYLADAKQVAEAAHDNFFEPLVITPESTIMILKQGSLWFHSIMLRGFAALYQVDKNKKYVTSFRQSLDYAWINARDTETGLFNSDLSGRTTDSKKELLTQGAIIEMYARVATLQ